MNATRTRARPAPAEPGQQALALVRQGDALREAGQYRLAVSAYRRGLLELPPALRTRGRIADLLTSLGDAAFRSGQHEIAARALGDMVTAYGRLRDPFVYLRLGQARYELGDLDGAADDLMRAYVVGRGAAELADEDPKYLALLAQRAGLG